MKAKIILYDRIDEEEAERLKNLNIAPPEPKKVPCKIYFRKENVDVAYINDEQDIVLYILGGVWVVEYDEVLWVTIRDYLENE